MLKVKLIAALCAVLMLLAGCSNGEDSPADDFLEGSVAELSPAEFLSAVTEFDEYDGNVENIVVFLTNNRDEELHFDYWWQLEKDVGGEWKRIRFIKQREMDLLDRIIMCGTTCILCDLKDNVKQPLLPGHYRLWVGGENGRVPAEFTIKE